MPAKSPTVRALVAHHPLQRLSSPNRGLSAILHIVSLAIFANDYRHLLVTPNPINDSAGWHFQFLTIIGLTFSTIAFTLGLLADITLSPLLFRVKNYVTIAAAPMEVLVSMLYWGLRAIDPKLVLPDWAPKMHIIIDLGFHLIPTVVLVVDLLFFSPPWTIAALPATGLSSVIAIAYWFWVERCYQLNGFYPYPIFDEAGFEGRVALFAGSAVVMSSVTALLKWVYGAVNGREIPGDVKGERKTK